MNNAFQDVAALLAQVAEDHKVPGLAAAGIVNGELAHAAVHGFRDQEQQKPMTLETPSRWYSISKPLTAMALGQLVFQGKIRWDQPLIELLPDLCFSDPVVSRRVTLTDCLLHRTGLPTGNWTWWQAPSNPTELLRRLPHLPCSAGFRVQSQYQNLQFALFHEVFKACGTTWHQAMQDLLQPLGIKALTKLSDFVASDRAIGYGPNGFAPAKPALDFDFEAIAPASAVCGSILELAKVAGTLALKGQGLVPPSVWAEVTRSALGLPPPEWSELQQPCVCLAGRSVVYRGELMLQWAGGWRGYVAHVLAIPAKGVAACAMANRSSSPAAELLAFELLDRSVGWQTAPWAERFLQQKRRNRTAGPQRLAARLARPAASWQAGDVAACYTHPAYGDMQITDDGKGPTLHFRGESLPLVPRPDGSVSADGTSNDFSELCWDLWPVIDGRRVVAWDFGPDDPKAPCCFERIG